MDDCAYYFLESGRIEFFLKKDFQVFLLNVVSVIFNENFIGKKKMKKMKFLVFFFFKENVWFGELSFFANCERKESVRSVKYSTVITIEREDFLRIITENEKDYVKNSIFFTEKISLKIFDFFH